MKQKIAQQFVASIGQLDIIKDLLTQIAETLS